MEGVFVQGVCVQMEGVCVLHWSAAMRAKSLHEFVLCVYWRLSARLELWAGGYARVGVCVGVGVSARVDLCVGVWVCGCARAFTERAR